MKPEIFRQYDIRGVVNEDLTPETVTLLGKAMGTLFRRDKKTDVAVGRDCRLSSPSFFDYLSEGLQSTGCHVISLGTIPTPLLYFSIFRKNLDAGVMITGSHNPPEYNGFKVMLGKKTLYGDDITQLYELVQNKDFVKQSSGKQSHLDVIQEYKDFVVDNINIKNKIKVVIDPGNGTGGPVAVPIFKRLGCEVIELNCDMDGHFPNHHPDPTVPEALEDLIETVSQTRADLGISYDGDSDRIGVIDDQGGIIWGDKLMILLSRDILPSHPGAPVISEVKASKLLYEEIERLGGRPIMWKTGHSLIKKKIKEENAILAGEMSGHIFFADRFFGYDDAIYASARVAEIISKSDQKLSEMLSDLPQTYTTPEIRIYSSDKVKFKIVEEVKKELSKKYKVIDIDGVRALFPKGWGLVRASNTQGALVLRFEADTKEDLDSIQTEVEKTVENAIRRISES
ncbi:MAG: phosphomannomutase [Candidatus Aminicenantes bacterium]|nr:phosphomannomutase [Candidatus Aminicenantes bacterium]